MSYWGLKVVFCDSENNQLLTLGGAAWMTKRERDANFSAIPASRAESPYIVDVENGDGIVDDRLIDEKTVERLLGRPVSALIMEARELCISPKSGPDFQLPTPALVGQGRRVKPASPDRDGSFTLATSPAPPV